MTRTHAPLALTSGGSCTVAWSLTNPSIWGHSMHCRAQHRGPEKAVVGAIRIFYSLNGDTRAIGLLPMTVAIGITTLP